MPRPLKQDAEKRTEQVKIRLTTAEIEYLRAQSQKAGNSVSDYVRKRALGMPVVPTFSKSDPALVSELNRIGVNVNQLARSVHTGRDFAAYWKEVGHQLQSALTKVLERHGS